MDEREKLEDASVFVRIAISYQGWGQVQYLYLVLVLKYIFIST